MVNAGLHGADGVILDLEDSVHPAEKDAARLLVRNALRTIDFGGAERMVRINQLPLGLADLDAIVPEGADLVLIPKVESREEVREVAARIATVSRRVRRRAPVWLMPILESALGIENAFAIARAHPTVVALTIGLEDYTADLGVVKTPEGVETTGRAGGWSTPRAPPGSRRSTRSTATSPTSRASRPGRGARARWDSRGWVASTRGRSR